MVIFNPGQPYSGRRFLIGQEELVGHLSENLVNGEFSGLPVWVVGLGEGEGGAYLIMEFVKLREGMGPSLVEREGVFLEQGEEADLFLRGKHLVIRGG